MAAQNGIFHFRGRSGKSYSISAYFDDTAGNPVRFSAAGAAGAGSPTDWIPPELVALVDVVLGAATTKTQTQIVVNGQPTGDMLLNALHLASVVVRPQLAIAFSPLARVGAYQIS